MRLIKASNLDPLYLFIAPPSFQELRVRLSGRGTENEDSIAKRLAAAVKEIDYAREPGVHDVVVVNDDIEKAYEKLKKIALAESSEGDSLPDLQTEEDKQ